jgi:hypothetical protein
MFSAHNSFIAIVYPIFTVARLKVISLHHLASPHPPSRGHKLLEKSTIETIAAQLCPTTAEPTR